MPEKDAERTLGPDNFEVLHTSPDDSRFRLKELAVSPWKFVVHTNKMFLSTSYPRKEWQAGEPGTACVLLF